MPKLPVLDGSACVKALERLGFTLVRRRGSHVVKRNGPRGCGVPVHREIKPGTLHGILRQGEIDRDQFIDAARR